MQLQDGDPYVVQCSCCPQGRIQDCTKGGGYEMQSDLLFYFFFNIYIFLLLTPPVSTPGPILLLSHTQSYTLHL